MEVGDYKEKKKLAHIGLWQEKKELRSWNRSLKKSSPVCPLYRSGNRSKDMIYKSKITEEDMDLDFPGFLAQCS